MITVQDIMTRQPITLSKFNTLNDAREMMDKRRFRHIPIVDEDNFLIGLVTQRNVLAHAVSQQNDLDSEELQKIESSVLLADIMTTSITTITPDVKIANAAHIVHQKKYGCLPVVNRDHKLVGIITDHDFVEITINLLDMIDETEPLELD